MTSTAPASDERTPLLNGRQSQTQSVSQKLTPTVSKPDLIWILAGIWGPVFLGALDGTIVATLLTPIGSYFQKSHQASYLGTSYLLSVAACTPLYGRLSDILGRKGAMLLGLSLFATGTLLCGMAPSMEFLIAARALAGTGGGGIMTVSSVVVTDLVPLKSRGLYQGMANVMFGLGAGLGGPLGGWINDTFGWRWAFLFQLPLMVMSFIIISWKVNIPLPAAVANSTLSEKLRRIDFLGALFLVMAITSFLLPISLKNSEDLSWSDPLVYGLLIWAVVSSAGFLAAELKWSTYPVMPPGLISQRTPFFVALTNFFVNLSAFSMLYNVPLYFSAVRLTSATESGAHLLPNSIALSLGSLFAGWVMRATGKYWTLIVASNIMTVVASLLVALWKDETNKFELWFDIAPSGFGCSSVITATLIAMVAGVSRADIAVATGITYLFRTVGQVLGVSLSGALVQGILLKKLREKITGSDAAEIIEKIRHSTEFLKTLEGETQQHAINAYKAALQAVFISQAAVCVLAVLASLPIQEFPLPGTLEQRSNNEDNPAE